uniref:Peptidase n=1 Tax=Pristionchus pacificus TaxID=54126 RepID=A0A2A6CS08_PRIPA|eukprot:PDM80876.1 Peptidase [Pristionchus pacificus]
MTSIHCSDLADTTIPESFDARQAWPQCPEIPMIRDQSSCGSCWAMATGEIISDRICIASGGSQQFNISSDDLMSCCGLQCGNGCNGGNPLSAMKWYVSHGVVTGSNYEDHSCVEGYPLTYAQDKHYGKSAYGLSRKVVDIQKEIMTNGPIVAGFNVYEDFEQYSGGIYAHHAGKYLGGHAVKVIGWGQENGTPYWLVNNSWNTDWGENGLFRIIRGTNDCGFEASMVAGLPKL